MGILSATVKDKCQKKRIDIETITSRILRETTVNQALNKYTLLLNNKSSGRVKPWG